MANKVTEHSFSGNYPKVLARQMSFESIRHMPFGKWAGYTTPKGRAVSPQHQPRPTNSVVTIQNELKRRGGELLEIPLHRNLTSRPRIGNEQMKDHEEIPKVNFAQIPIELTRAGELPQDGSMMTQVTKDIDFLRHSKPALQNHYARFLNWLVCAYTLYNGYSWNVLNSARWAGDAKIKKSSHPHIFISGSGKVSYGVSNYPGTAGYETQIGTDITAMASGDVFDTSFLQGLKAAPEVQKIPPVLSFQGQEMRFILAHPWQIVTLENDANFQTVANRAFVQTMAKENPFLLGAKYYYAGFAIFENDTAVFPVSVNAGVPVWGPSDADTFTDITTFENYSSATAFGALLLGANAIGIANGDSLDFRKRVDDYGEIIGIIYRVMQGASRMDYWNRDDGSSGQYLVQERSAILVTSASAPTF